MKKIPYTLSIISLLIGCSNITKPTVNQAIINVISTDSSNLKILSLNGESKGLFFSKSQHLIEAGETKFSIRCFFRNRKSFVKFNIQTKPKKVYNIQSKCYRDSTIYTISVDGKIVATKKVQTKFFNNNSNQINF